MPRYSSVQVAEKALIEAVKENNHKDVQSILLDNPDMRMNPPTHEGARFTAMHLAAEKGFVECMEAIISAIKAKFPGDASIGYKIRDVLEAKGPENWTPLHLAVDSQQKKAVDWLLKQKIPGVQISMHDTTLKQIIMDPNPYADSGDGLKGYTPLLLAAEKSSLDIVKALLDSMHKLDPKKKVENINETLTVDEQDNLSMSTRVEKTPLQNAVDNKKYGNANLLIQHGADISAYSNWNELFNQNGIETILQIALPADKKDIDDQSRDNLIKICGYAVLQRIEKSSWFITGENKVFYELLKNSLENDEIMSSDIEATIFAAMIDQNFGASDEELHWAGLRSLSESSLLSNKKIKLEDIRTALKEAYKEQKDESIKRSEQIAGVDDDVPDELELLSTGGTENENINDASEMMSPQVPQQPVNANNKDDEENKKDNDTEKEKKDLFVFFSNVRFGKERNKQKETDEQNEGKEMENKSNNNNPL